MSTSYNQFSREDCAYMEAVDAQCILHMRATSHHPSGILVLPPHDPKGTSAPITLLGSDYGQEGTFISLPGGLNRSEPRAQRSPEDLADLLECMSRLVRCHDSYEGSISWTFGETPESMSVAMAVRSGNLGGQGSVCIL